MPDAVVSQTIASAQFDRLLLPLRIASMLEEIGALFSTNAVYIRQDGGWLAGVRQITQWAIIGANLSDVGRNVSDGGFLWARITANAGNWDIHVYKATGAASEVMTATNVAAGATATLAAANSSGMSGTCVLGASPAAIAADTYRLQVLLGFGEMTRQIFNGVHQEDTGISTDLLARIAGAASALQQVRESFVAAVKRAGTEQSPGLLRQLGRIWKINAGLTFLDKQATVDSGTVTVLVAGIIEQLRQNWVANTTEQKVPVTTVAAGSVSYPSVNQGTIVTTKGTLGENIEPGLLQATCKREGPDYDNIQFEVTFTPTDGVGEKTAAQLLTVGKSWDDPDIPIPLSVVFSYLLADDDTDNTDVAAVTQITGITGLTTTNSDAGKLYGSVVASGSAFIYKFYSASARTAASLVAQSPAVAAGASFTATAMNGSNVQVGWKAGSAPADGDLFSINIRPSKVGDSTHAADSFSIPITRSALGWIQDLARRYLEWKFASGGSPTFADTFGQRGCHLIDGQD